MIRRFEYTTLSEWLLANWLAEREGNVRCVIVQRIERTTMVADTARTNPTPKQGQAWGREVKRRLAQREEARRNIVMCQGEED